MKFAIALLASMLCVVAPAAAEEAAPVPIPIAEWSTAKVARLGRAIFEQDRAAWVATDRLLAHLENAAPPEGLVGWIVVPDGRNQVVRFIREADGAFFAVYDVAVVDGQAGALKNALDAPLNAEQTAMANARLTAVSNIGRLRCSPTFNTVVLDDPDSDGWLVWLLTATTDGSVLPLGGHYRFTTSADGLQVKSRDMLSNACLFMPRTPDFPEGADSVGMVVSQIVSKGPVETHVFLSLANNIPLYVAAGDKLFAVNGDAIASVSTED